MITAWTISPAGYNISDTHHLPFGIQGYISPRRFRWLDYTDYYNSLLLMAIISIGLTQTM